jgi:hypothetical protein
MKDNEPLVVAYGGGTNSAAMLCGFLERDIVPDLILFADTGGELPRTYDHIHLMDQKCREWWGIGIEIVEKLYQGKTESLEAACIRKRQLPSLAYGRKACSMKHKIEPQVQRVKRWMDERNVKTVWKAIGYDVAEGHRAHAKEGQDLKKGRMEKNYYPLIEWRWNRQACIAQILKHNLPLPGKSSCFFCPSMKIGEILKLRDEAPEYFDRAINIEKNVHVTGPKEGLHFGVKWSDIVAASDAQMKLFEWLDENDAVHQPCGCYDG